MLKKLFLIFTMLLVLGLSTNQLVKAASVDTCGGCCPEEFDGWWLYRCKAYGGFVACSYTNELGQN